MGTTMKMVIKWMGLFFLAGVLTACTFGGGGSSRTAPDGVFERVGDRPISGAGSFNRVGTEDQAGF